MIISTGIGSRSSEAGGTAGTNWIFSSSCNVDNKYFKKIAQYLSEPELNTQTILHTNGRTYQSFIYFTHSGIESSLNILKQ